MHEAHEGKTILLAKSGGLGEISMCGCGVISVHLGGVTLRLESETLVQVERMLQEALASLCQLAVQLHEGKQATTLVQ